MGVLWLSECAGCSYRTARYQAEGQNGAMEVPHEQHPSRNSSVRSDSRHSGAARAIRGQNPESVAQFVSRLKPIPDSGLRPAPE
ncbi:MAG: hypothetical protein OJF61_000705 [Rhodanobacteraceae bacterium]|nr:MAG: hypothetical protein OJF61_000705 [Rhodanobacteraceae bacterium]